MRAQEGGLLPGETLQDNPKDRPIQLTLTVADDSGPTTPLLISPTDNALITDSTPGLIWEESTDTQGMGYYQLYIDGSLLFNNIPLTPTSNASYTLTKSGDEYTLVPVTPFSSGSHTWKIRAVDDNGTGTDSATWTFTIDNTAPTLVITQIDGTTTNISAQDLSTLPDPYVEVADNEPVLTGTTEGSSTIQITVEIPSQSSLNYTITADSGGNWIHALPLLPRDTIITLQFIVTDLAGNVTVLNDVHFLIPTEFLFTTPTNTPIPGTTSAPAEPTSTPGEDDPGDEEDDDPIIDIPNIPLLPPKEIVVNVINAIIPSIITENIPEIVKEIATAAAPVGAVIIAVGLPAAGAFAVASQFGLSLSFQILIRILQAIGIIPPPEPQGLVFNSRNQTPVPFAILQIIGVDTPSITETIITNTEGVYGGISLPSGKYQIAVRHQDFAFPSVIQKPNYFSMKDFYKGEQFQVMKDSAKELFLIPLDPLRDSQTMRSYFSWPVIRERLVRFTSYLFFPLFFVTLLITIISPSIFNVMITGGYFIIALLKLLRSVKIPTIRGKVVNDTGEALENVFVRVFAQESDQLVAVLRTNKKGVFKAVLPKGLYQVTLTKQDFIWMESGQVQQFYQADTREKRQVVLAVMKELHGLLGR